MNIFNKSNLFFLKITYKKVKLNYWRGGDCPFGYKLCSDGNGNKLVVNEDESKWVLFIFNEYSQGTTLKEIKLQLERNGIKTRRGNVYWSLGSLQVILRNEIYIGVDVFVDKKTNLKITNTIPQIISNKLWGLVQEKRKLKLLRKGQFNRTTNSLIPLSIVIPNSSVMVFDFSSILLNLFLSIFYLLLICSSVGILLII